MTKMTWMPDGEDITLDRILAVMEDLDKAQEDGKGAPGAADEDEATDTGIYPEVVRSALLMAAERIVGGQGDATDVELFNSRHEPGGSPIGGRFARTADTGAGMGGGAASDDPNYSRLTDALVKEFGEHPDFGKATNGWIAPDGRIIHDTIGGHFMIATSASKRLGLGEMGKLSYEAVYETLFTRGFIRVVHTDRSTSFEWSTPLTEDAYANLQSAFDTLRPATWYVDFWPGTSRGTEIANGLRSIQSNGTRAPEKLKRETGIDVSWWSKSNDLFGRE